MPEPKKIFCRRCHKPLTLPPPPKILYSQTVVGDFKATRKVECPHCKVIIYDEFCGRIEKTLHETVK